MDFNTFLDHFDTIAEAPGGIAKLKALILDLAVRGKLVPQKPDEEPASVLIDKINFEKEQLVKGKKIRKADPLPPIELDELPYELPNGWEWVRFGSATICRDGERIPLSKDERATRQGKYDYYGASGIIDKIDDYLFDKPLLLIGEDGANLVNRSTPIAFIASGKYWVNNHAHVLDGLSLDCLKYFEVFINAIDLKPYVTGTAQPKMNQAKMNSIPVPLPPLTEQKRIVEKVDELMALCDRLSAAKQTRDDLRQKLRGSAISALMNAETDEALEKSWAIVRDNWHTLSQDPKDVDELRQPILKLALQGKLTSPIFSKVVLEELIERFVAERLSLHLSEQDKKKILLELDKTYKRLEETDSQLTIAARCICDFITKGTTPANNELLSKGEIPYIKVYNIVEQELNFFYKPTYISREVHETKLKRSKVLPGDVLMNIVGPPLGKVAIVPDTFQEWNLNQALAIFRPLPSINKRFLYYALSCYSTLKTVLTEPLCTESA